MSIVIPVYNGSNFLDEAIKSALAQTYRNREIIVVNDGSRDEGRTEAVALSHGSAIRYFAKENGGVASALNHGIARMTGDYFAWLSHDDLYLPRKLEIQLSRMCASPAARVSSCDTIIFRGAPGKFPETEYRENDVATSDLVGPLSFFRDWLYACSLVIDRACFEVVGPFDESLLSSQDVDITLRLLRVFPFRHVRLPLTRRRDHPASGFNTRRSEVSTETSRLMMDTLAAHGPSFFLPPGAGQRETSRLYELMGDFLVNDKRASAVLYQTSVDAWPDIRNPSRAKLALGNAFTRLWLRTAQGVRSRMKR